MELEGTFRGRLTYDSADCWVNDAQQDEARKEFGNRGTAR